MGRFEDKVGIVTGAGGGIGQALHLGEQPINFSVQAYWNAVHPDPGPTWTIRTNFQLLFPTAKIPTAKP